MTSLPGMTLDPSAPPPLLLDSSYVSPDYGNLSLLSSLPAANISSNKLYQVPVGFIVLLSIFYGIISLVAVAGNFMVMWIVATSRRMQTVTNFFIANLAVADIIIGLFSIPFQFQAALLQRWVLPEFMCAFCPFVQVLSVNVSIFTLTAIALDRYRAVMSPLKARTTKLRAKFIICGIWTLAVAAALPCALALRVETQVESHALNLTKPFCHEVGISRKAWRIYNHVLVCLQYFFPLLTICFVYARMGLKLKESKSPGNAQGARDAGILKNKKKGTPGEGCSFVMTASQRQRTSSRVFAKAAQVKQGRYWYADEKRGLWRVNVATRKLIARRQRALHHTEKLDRRWSFLVFAKTNAGSLGADETLRRPEQTSPLCERTWAAHDFVYCPSDGDAQAAQELRRLSIKRAVAQQPQASRNRSSCGENDEISKDVPFGGVIRRYRQTSGARPNEITSSTTAAKRAASPLKRYVNPFLGETLGLNGRHVELLVPYRKETVRRYKNASGDGGGLPFSATLPPKIECHALYMCSSNVKTAALAVAQPSVNEHC
ncbi:hypothetical protein MRX96_034777 [Rhipicephalus microplus]